MELRGRQCQCGGCGGYLNSPSPFHMHRVGKYRRVGPDYGRRCLSAREMELMGMIVNRKGFWISEPLGDGLYHIRGSSK